MQSNRGSFNDFFKVRHDPGRGRGAQQWPRALILDMYSRLAPEHAILTVRHRLGMSPDIFFLTAHDSSNNFPSHGDAQKAWLVTVHFRSA